MRNSSSVAVASRSFSKHPVLRQELQARYEKVTFNESGRMLEGEELISLLKGHDKVIIGLEVVNEAVLAGLPELRVIGKHGVGLDKIDFEALERRGILFGWTGGVNRRSVAELAIGFMLALLRHTPQCYREVLDRRWQPRVGRQLTERTVGIIGCGYVGKDLTQLLAPFKCRVLAHDIRSFPDFYQFHGVQAVELETLLTEADIVTLHVPLDASTRGLLSAERLRKMKPGSILVNTARGGLVDEMELKTLLKSGHLSGAAFDVFAVEPPLDEELLGLPNFFATPHIGGSAEEALLAMGRAAIRGLEDAQPVKEFLKTLS